MTIILLLATAVAIGFISGKALGKLDQILEAQKAIMDMLSDLVLKTRDSNSPDERLADLIESECDQENMENDSNEDIDIVKHLIKFSTTVHNHCK